MCIFLPASAEVSIEREEPAVMGANEERYPYQWSGNMLL